MLVSQNLMELCESSWFALIRNDPLSLAEHSDDCRSELDGVA